MGSFDTDAFDTDAFSEGAFSFDVDTGEPPARVAVTGGDYSNPSVAGSVQT